jgi:hypothetical protein
MTNSVQSINFSEFSTKFPLTNGSSGYAQLYQKVGRVLGGAKTPENKKRKVLKMGKMSMTKPMFGLHDARSCPKETTINMKTTKAIQK